MICDGSEVSKTLFANLYEVVGDSFGKATDTNKFKLPDLRETVPVGINTNTTNTITNHDTYTLGQFKDDNVRTLVYADNNKDFPIIVKTNDSSHEKHKGMIISVESAGNEPSFLVGTGNTGSTHGKQLGVNYIIKAEFVKPNVDEKAMFISEENDTYIEQADGQKHCTMYFTIYGNEMTIFAIQRASNDGKTIAINYPLPYKELPTISITYGTPAGIEKTTKNTLTIWAYDQNYGYQKQNEMHFMIRGKI